MTIYLIPCHSREISKAWKQQTISHGMGFIRSRKDGSYTLNANTRFYTAFEVALDLAAKRKDYFIFEGKRAIFTEKPIAT